MGLKMERWRLFLNKTLLVLIPKVVGLELVSQFHPINLYIVPYMLLTMVIVNRLKPVMLQLVAENQKSFVGSHHIMDNVIITQEVMHSMCVKKGKRGWMGKDRLGKSV